MLFSYNIVHKMLNVLNIITLEFVIKFTNTNKHYKRLYELKRAATDEYETDTFMLKYLLSV